MRIALAIGYVVILSMDDESAAERPSDACRPLIAFNRRVGLAVAHTIRSILREELAARRRVHRHFVGNVSKPVIEGKHHRETIQLDTVAPILAIHPEDLVGR